MTQKDFQFIAAILFSLRPDKYNEAEHAAWRFTVDRFASRLWDDNPRFDLAKFMVACGVVDAATGKAIRGMRGGA